MFINQGRYNAKDVDVLCSVKFNLITTLTFCLQKTKVEALNPQE